MKMNKQYSRKANQIILNFTLNIFFTNYLNNENER